MPGSPLMATIWPSCRLQPKPIARSARRVERGVVHDAGQSTAQAGRGGGGGIRTLGAGVTHTTVFETARFNHSRTPPRAPRARRDRLATRREERAQQGRALVREQASGDLRAVVEPRLGEDVEDAAGRARPSDRWSRRRRAAPARARSRRRTWRRARASRRGRSPAAATSRAPARPPGAPASPRGRWGPGAARARCGRPRRPRRRAPDRPDRDVVVLERALGLGQREPHELLVAPGEAVGHRAKLVSSGTHPGLW